MVQTTAFIKETPLIDTWKQELCFFVLALILVAVGIFCYQKGVAFEKWNIFISMAMLFLAGPIIALLFRSAPDSDKYREVRVVFFLFLTCGTMLSLQNWEQVQTTFIDRPISTAILIIASFFAVAQIIDSINKNASAKKVSGMQRLMLVVPWIIFYLFARRTDSLAVIGSSYHWEYFVGPIRAIKNGGIPLWDTPSQYGFLNVVIPALLPIHSAWKAFYWFQSALYFISAGLIYLTLTRSLRINRSAACVLSIATFFLAFPTPLIGPAPFPSSSSARFFPCYVMLFLAAECFLQNRKCRVLSGWAA